MDATVYAFALSSLIITIAPGPFTIYLLSRSIGQGSQAGVVSTLGAAVATSLHSLAAAFGFAMILTTSAIAFDLVKYAGAAYLLYLGVRALVTGKEELRPINVQRLTLRRIFWQSFVTGLLNPKVAIFFLSYLPQFVRPENGSTVAQIIFLGAIFNLIGAVWFVLLATFAGQFGDWLKRNPHYLAAQKWITGLTFVSLGVNAALARRD
jgi:threonine/homoserine/homoserine lactone efflux protein